MSSCEPGCTHSSHDLSKVRDEAGLLAHGFKKNKAGLYVPPSVPEEKPVEIIDHVAERRRREIAGYQWENQRKRDERHREWVINCRVYMEAVAEGLPNAAKFKRPCIVKTLVVPPLTRPVKLRFDRVMGVDTVTQATVWGWKVSAKSFERLQQELYK